MYEGEASGSARDNRQRRAHTRVTLRSLRTWCIITMRVLCTLVESLSSLPRFCAVAHHTRRRQGVAYGLALFSGPRAQVVGVGESPISTVLSTCRLKDERIRRKSVSIGHRFALSLVCQIAVYTSSC